MKCHIHRRVCFLLLSSDAVVTHRMRIDVFCSCVRQQDGRTYSRMFFCAFLKMVARLGWFLCTDFLF